FGDAEGPNARDWAAIEAEAAAVPAGAEGLIFLPYLTGERGPGGATMRGQFLGLSAHHGRAHLYRAVMEGVALAARADLVTLARGGAAPTRLTAIGGGAKSALWPTIKAAAYGLPLDIPETAEGGLIGCAALAGIGAGVWPDAGAAVADLVRIARTVDPDPALARTYRRLATVFDEAHETARRHCARLSAIAAAP
ncbi:MAG: pentose kinase, partial [Alphaproteobacteria bacterium]|nr:pentose kinase [Alphaproteobacteria bacterium]